MRVYKIPESKISVVHNAVSRREAGHIYHNADRGSKARQVLFMGRVTFQKGPDYFVEAARLVLNVMPDVRFVVAGSGDMLRSIVARVAHYRMGHRFTFTGFLKHDEVDRMYASSDLYVMPSVSEPFGIAPLEAMVYDVPVLMSKQSGVSEVIHNALKVDFWDVRKMAENNLGSTQYFRTKPDQELEVKEILDLVYNAMEEKGYNPVNQIVGYIMSGDPTYITSHKGARSMIMKVERDELVEELLTEYIKNRSWEY
jgi:uncharacterized protein (UPF0297 family)